MRLELARLRDELQDLEDMHSFTFEKTPVHIGSEKAHNMQAEFEEERARCLGEIARIEDLLRSL